MTYTGLSEFIDALDKEGELHHIKTFSDPVLEITEITDRISKNKGKALLFENTGTQFPLLINAFGSDKRLSMALGIKNPEEAGNEIISLFENISSFRGSLFKKLSVLPELMKMAAFLPSRLNRRGICQQVIHKDPDLGILPVLKCWPHDGGRFITLPMVHTCHPLTGKTNVGMYRMQILGKSVTGMHWQMHKTGARHFEEWKRTGKKMPVSVALGGDPVYTYSSTAPLPENIDEYILAGFLRKKKVKLVKCITNDLYVPDDADIIIEGYVDPARKPILEGPFGDHTGFYSLADWYPEFHVTCITHSKKAVYPATIVGVPPQEDAWLAKATEKIFLAPIKLALQPEIDDFHMPDAGIAHNLVIVKINKSYPGQGRKVISALLGAGQMMFTKYIAVVSGNVNIRDYRELIITILKNTNLRNDLIFSSGPLDVLDHSSDTFSFGGKLGIDATVKSEEEMQGGVAESLSADIVTEDFMKKISGTASAFNVPSGLPLLIVALTRKDTNMPLEKLITIFRKADPDHNLRAILVVDREVDVRDLFMVTWQILGNSDPVRDVGFISDEAILINGSVKAFRAGGFPRKWPNVVCSSEEIIEKVDKKWESLELGPFLSSPSLKLRKLLMDGNEEVIAF